MWEKVIATMAFWGAFFLILALMNDACNYEEKKKMKKNVEHKNRRKKNKDTRHLHSR